jgi:tRNA (cytidine/uridine-2'-O-)-methyltransferase
VRALHLVEPLRLLDGRRQLKRAGLDYHEMASVSVQSRLEACRAALGDRRCSRFPRAHDAVRDGCRYDSRRCVRLRRRDPGPAQALLDSFPADRNADDCRCRPGKPQP